jgi:predicted nucleotidyltransferase
MIEITKINDIVNRIAIKFNPDKIILFGSYAAGNPTNDSDIDLLIIKDTDLPRHKRSFDIQKSLIGSMVPMDILVYTTEEFEKEKNVKDSFLFSAIRTSKILYERGKQNN